MDQLVEQYGAVKRHTITVYRSFIGFDVLIGDTAEIRGNTHVIISS